MLEKQALSDSLKDLKKIKDLPKEKEIIKEEGKNQKNLKDLEELKKIEELKESRFFLSGNLRYLKENKLKAKNKNKEIMPEYKKKTQETFKDLRKFLELSGAKMVEDVGTVYNYYETHSLSPLVVRREDPEKVVNLVGDGKLSLGFDTKVAGDRGDKYANCSLWPYGPTSSGGLLNAFAEGHGHAGPLITVIAVDPRIGGNLTVEEPRGKMHQLGTLNRASVKILSGDIKPENLEFIISRINVDYFSEDLLTKEEKNLLKNKKDGSSPIFIHRAFVFSKKLKNKLKEEK